MRPILIACKHTAQLNSLIRWLNVFVAEYIFKIQNNNFHIFKGPKLHKTK